MTESTQTLNSDTCFNRIDLFSEPTLVDFVSPAIYKNCFQHAEIQVTDLKSENQFSELEKANVKKCIHDFCNDTSTHGLKNLANSNINIIKLAWVILLLTAIGYSSYAFINSVELYLKFDTKNSIQLVYESPMEFPAVTICNLGAFNLNASANTNNYINNICRRNNIPVELVIEKGKTAWATVDSASSLIKAFVTGDTCLNETQRKSVGFSLDSLLISCFFNNKRCDQNDFSYFRDHEFGNCFTFNGLFDANGVAQPSRKVSKPGLKNGLNLELFTGLSHQNDKYMQMFGMVLSIHPRGQLPLPVYDGITLPSAMSTNIGVNQIRTSKLEWPFSNCLRIYEDTQVNTKYFQKTMEVSSRYSKRICHEICLNFEFIIPKCNCSDPSVPTKEADLNYCKSTQSLECIERIRNKFDTDYLNKYCGDECPISCESVEYSTSTSFASYPTKYYSNLILDQNNIVSKFFNTNSSDGQLGEEMGCYKPYMISTEDPSRNKHPNKRDTINLKEEKIQNGPNQNGQSSNNHPSDTISFEAQLNQSISQVIVYFKTLDYTLISEEQAMSFDTLIGLVGGQLGACLGISVLTIFEVLELFVNLIRIYHQHIIKNSRIRNFSIKRKSKD